MDKIKTCEDFKEWYFDFSFFKQWLDKIGMVHVQRYPNIPNNASSNGALFTPELLMALEIKYKNENDDRMSYVHDVFAGIVQSHITNKKFNKKGKLVSYDFLQMPWDPNDPSSYDNDTGLRSYSFFKEEEYHKKARIIGRFWHPRDILYFNWLKGGWRRWLLYLTCTWPFIILIQAWTCWFGYAKNGTEVDTSGKNMVWLRCVCTMHKSWVMALSYRLSERLLKRHNNLKDQIRGGVADISSFRKCYEYYFRKKGHPTPLVMAEIYDN